MRNFGGRTAFITGGVSGIGLGLAKVLAREGMKVAIAYRSDDHRDQAMAWFRDRPGETVLPVRLDVTDREGWVRAVDEAEAALGPIALLCNNAGVGVIGPMEQASYADWDWVLGVNLGGVVNGIVTVVPRMIARGPDKDGSRGHVVNVSSIGGLAALGTAGVYCASKFAVTGLTEALRSDLKPHGIGVSVYCPGPVRTNITEAEARRPAEFGGAGYSHVEPRKGAIFSNDSWMDPVEAGERILEAVKADELYILSHPELRAAIRERHDAIEAAWPDEPINLARAATITNLLTTPIYTEHLTRGD